MKRVRRCKRKKGAKGGHKAIKNNRPEQK